MVTGLLRWWRAWPWSPAPAQAGSTQVPHSILPESWGHWWLGRPLGYFIYPLIGLKRILFRKYFSEGLKGPTEVVLGCGAQTVPLYLLGQFAGAILAVALVAATARTGPLNPQVSKPALGLSDREAWRLWLTGSPPSRLRGMNTETVETIHDYHLQLLHFHEGKPTEAFQRSSTSDLQRLFGVNAHACQRTSASASQIAEPGSLTEASREVALMLQHPEITLRETMPDTSPMDIFRSCTDEEVV